MNNNQYYVPWSIKIEFKGDCGDETSMVLLDEDHLGDTIIAGNTYINGDSIM